MVNQEILEIILKAQDNASDTAKKVEDQMKKIGDSTMDSNHKIAQSSQMTAQKMGVLTQNLNKIAGSSAQVGAKGAGQFKRYNSTIQDSIVKFNMLDDETREWLSRLSNASNPKLFYDLNTKCQEAVAKFNEMDNVTNSWSGSLDYAKTKLQILGTDTDSLKGKIQVAGNAVTTYLGTKWDNVKTKVTTLASYIQTKLTSALSRVRSAVDSLGSAFGGLGGLIASAIGGLGMASITDLTVGLAMNRERMTALTNATMGSVKAGDQMINGYTGVNKVFKDLDGTMTNTFMGLDEMTNHSLVSLDDIGQAMSVIKMSTGMTNEQLMAFSSTVNDIGQRAILMGKSGDEAIGLMQAAGKGLNGEFDMLKTNFGITADQLKELGWSGAADDVEGYQKALDKALEKGGSMNDMMDTSTGHLETLKKNFRVAGRHVGEMFTPYIDQAVQWLNSLKDTCPGLFENLVMVAGAVSMFATIAPTLSPMLQAFDMLSGKIRPLLMFLGILEAEEGALTISGLSAAASQTMLSIAEAAGAEAAVLETAANAGLTASFWAMAAAILANPLTWVVLALIAIAVAVYEVGKAFGWWTDVGSMIQAIISGIQRMWNHFINHPDVKAMIAAISNALSTLWNWIQQAGQAIMEFFNISTGGDFDIVLFIMEAIGQAWEIFKWKIQMVITVVTTLWNVINVVFNAIWSVVSPIVTQIINLVNGLIGSFNAFKAGQISLPQLILSVLTQIVTTYNNVVKYILSLVLRFGAQLLNRGVTAARNFVNGIVNWVRQLPGKVYNILMQVVRRIISAGSQWVTTAKAKAKSIVDNVYNTLSGLPGKIASALSGVVNAITKPFQDAYNNVAREVDKIKRKAEETLHIKLPAGGEPLAAAGETLIGNATINGSQYIGNTASNPIIIEDNITLSLDLRNVPEHISSSSLIEALTDKKVVSAIANNRDFQSIDAQVKQKINLKQNRSGI